MRAMFMSKHFVTFYSPGSFVAEQTTQPIDAWDNATALALASNLVERHGARPYGFRFTTRTRGDADLDSKVAATSPMHYFNAKIETMAEVEAREPGSILAKNMRCNGWSHIVTTLSGYRWSAPLKQDDVVLDATGAVMPR